MKTTFTNSLMIGLVLMTNMVFTQTFTNFSVLSTGGNLLDNNIQAIAIDQSGNKWIGTNYGVSVFNSSDLWLFNDTSVDELQTDNDFIRDIDVDSHGNVWIGNFVSYMFKGSITKFDGTTWTTYAYDTLSGGWPVGLVNPNIYRMAVDQDDNLWVATGGGISKFNYSSSTFTNFTDSTSGLPFNVVQCVAIDNNNVKWFGTDNGLVKYDDAVWTLYTTIDGLIDNNISSIAVDVDNNIWIGSSDYGVTMFNGSTWNTFTSADGLVADGINYIACGPDGSVWFATYAGISRYKNSVWTSYTSADGLPVDCIYFITPEASTTMWVGTVCDGGFSKCTYTSGIDKVEQSTAYTVYPNPAQDFIHVSISNFDTGKTVEVFNIINQKIGEYSITEGSESITIPVKNLSDGIYFIRIGNSCKKVVVRK